MKVEVVQEDKKRYDGKKMIIWIPECSMNALKCLGGRSGDDCEES